MLLWPRLPAVPVALLAGVSDSPHLQQLQAGPKLHPHPDAQDLTPCPAPAGRQVTLLGKANRMSTVGRLLRAGP